jgi:2-polyprenyl-6-methoxyphenol hydroxylase-like FAD-dependent oxidoreductase
MSRIIVLGGGVCGLATGMMLRRDGHEVTILERDGAPVPDSPEEAWEDWSRDGVTQFRQGHYLHAGGRALLDLELPDVAAGLDAAGAARFDMLGAMPPMITDRAPREGDERFTTLTARRPTLEQVFGAAAQAEPGLEVRRGIGAKGLTTTTCNGTPHVTGVLTDAGEELTADLVVDAMGRRSQLPRWLSEAGCRAVHEEAEDSGFIYYGRYFRSPDGALPEVRGPLLAAIGSFSLLTLPSDNGTWCVLAFVASGDQPLKRLRDPDRWTAVVAACPLQAHWLEGEPITGLMAMGGVIDRYRRLVVDGQPVATGVALVADAWACTNPSLGRGITLGLLHAQQLRDVARTYLDNPREFAEAFDEVTEARLTPWYRETVEEDRGRLREIEALRDGREPPERSGPFAALVAAMPFDADVFRAFLETRSCFTTVHDVLARPGIAQRVRELGGAGGGAMPGPDRAQLLQMLN